MRRGKYGKKIPDIFKSSLKNKQNIMLNPILEDDLKRIHSSLHQREKLRDSVILITGCAGFLGYYLTHYFLLYSKELGIKKVIGLDTFLLDKAVWLQQLSAKYPNVLSLNSFDIANDSMAEIEGAKDANFVIHAASIASPTFYRQYPIETMDANIGGLRKLLDFYQEQPDLKGFLFFSSSEIYGDPDPSSIPTSEEYRGLVSCHGPRACYDEAKRFGETMCWVYAAKYDMPITVARPFNNYGPGMRTADKRLPADFALCILEDRDIVILSDGTPTRTFCYISDAITGYLLALLHGKYDYFNIGTEKPEISVRDFAAVYASAGAEVFGFSGKVIYGKSDDTAYMTDNPNRRCPVITKARNILGYSPIIGIEEGVKKYLQFLKLENNN